VPQISTIIRPTSLSIVDSTNGVGVVVVGGNNYGAKGECFLDVTGMDGP